jgi:hypothetical protein
MRRDFKKHLKELKRKRKKEEERRRNAENLFWPAIFCLGENIFIGVSLIYSTSRKLANGRIVSKTDWDVNCKFRKPEYKIDMSNAKFGDIIKCPKCGSNVDFRIWISAKEPNFVEVVNDKKNDTQEFPNTQKIDSRL